MAKAAKQEKRQESEKPEKSSDRARKKNPLLVAVAIAAPVFVVFIALTLLLGTPGVPFSLFKSNFYKASHASIVAVYANESQFVYEADCVVTLRELIHFSNASAVHVFFINSTNGTCTFSPSVTNATLQVRPASYCMGIADSEPSIILNYSSINASSVTAYRLYVHGNSEYMQRCPIAVDMS
ncbi:MAG: hypothetical protein QXT43_00315 [Candidatus Micrarchaeaceae archaeon]